ncbi:MAG: DUF2130 domain-containing protein [bacterium]
MQEQKIKCPSCDMEISLDEVMTKQIEAKIKKGFEEQQKIKEAEIAKKENNIIEQKREIEAREQNVNKQISEKLEEEKLKIMDAAKREAAEDVKLKMWGLEEMLNEKDKKLAEASQKELEMEKQKREFEENKKKFEIDKTRQIEAERKKIEEYAFRRAEERNELNGRALKRELEEAKNDRKIFEERANEAQAKEIEIRNEKNKLAEDKKNFELDKLRQLDEERKKIADDAAARAAEEQRYVIAQLQKKLSDATKAKDELSRKLEQGSQQTQGEVLELELEELLKQEFASDEIMPVPKGINGADIIQKVISRSGRNCGQIVWEVKKTKAWCEGWAQKLKDDQRIIKAELAVIVSAVLPENVKGFIFRDGVWICDIKMALALASALRINLEAVAREKAMAVGKNEKVEILYAYLTGVEFKQRVEAIVEAFTGMQDELNKEKRAYQKIWAEREKQIHKVMANTIGMYGDLSGLVALPQIKMLELESGAAD